MFVGTTLALCSPVGVESSEEDQCHGHCCAWGGVGRGEAREYSFNHPKSEDSPILHFHFELYVVLCKEV